jgi:hypothetical protein
LEQLLTEIDKANKRYVALDADLPQSGPGLLEDSFAHLALDEGPAVAFERWADTVETITIDKTARYWGGCKQRLVAMKHSP